MPHTVFMTVVQLLVVDMTFTSQATQEAVTILTLIVTRTVVPSVTIVCGPEATISALTT